MLGCHRYAVTVQRSHCPLSWGILMAKVLVIDDEADVRKIVVRVLERESHELFEAEDGVQGMELFHLHKPDLVITDIFMPSQEGIETIKQIRAESPAVRVLAMSGGGSGAADAYLRMSNHLGADATLTKPFRAPELIACVDRLLAAGEDRQ
jgi:CheY-like chemotaxis protein